MCTLKFSQNKGETIANTNEQSAKFISHKSFLELLLKKGFYGIEKEIYRMNDRRPPYLASLQSL
jgi:hypothetical protein